MDAGTNMTGCEIGAIPSKGKQTVSLMFFISVERTQTYIHHETRTNIHDRKVMMYSDITYTLP